MPNMSVPLCSKCYSYPCMCKPAPSPEPQGARAFLESGSYPYLPATVERWLKFADDYAEHATAELRSQLAAKEAEIGVWKLAQQATNVNLKVAERELGEAREALQEMREALQEILGKFASAKTVEALKSDAGYGFRQYTATLTDSDLVRLRAAAQKREEKV